MPAYLSPICNERQFDSNGNPLAGGLVYTYQAGTTTPIATYTDSAGGSQQTNPIVLTAGGLSSSPIWLGAGQAVKFVVQTSAGVTLRTIDNVQGLNDPAFSNTVDQWVAFGNEATYVSATSFYVQGDQTPTFEVGRRVRANSAGGVRYGTIGASTFSSGVTTVSLVLDSGALDAGTTQVAVGLLTATSPALPGGAAVRATMGIPLRGYLAGLNMSTAGSSSSFSVAVGEASDSTNTALIALSSAMTKTTGSWSAGTGNGALDTGSISPSSWYHAYVIRRPDTGAVDVLVSSNATTPNSLPASYTQFRRIGSLLTDGSSQWVAFSQQGDDFTWATSVTDVNATNPGTSAVTRTISSVPPGVVVLANLFVSIGGQAGTSNAARLSDLAVGDESPGAANSQVYFASVANAVQSASAQVYTNTSRQIRTRVATSDAGTQLLIRTQGWTDTRGRFA